MIGTVVNVQAQFQSEIKTELAVLLSNRVRPTYPSDGLSYLRKHLGQKTSLQIVE